MAENATKNTTKRTSTRKTAAKTQKVDIPVDVENTKIDVPVEDKPSKKKGKIQNNLMIPVISNKPNPIHYNCIRTFGEEMDWSGYGDIQELSFEELRAMKGRYPRFFRDNWIVLGEADDYTPEEIYAALGVTDQYATSVTPDTIMTLLDKSNSQLEEAIDAMPDPVKRTVYDIATQKKESGQFDSISKYNIIKKAAGMDVAE